MKDGLYHKTLGLPAVTIAPVLCLTPSLHARERACELNLTEIPKHFLPRVADVVEIEIEGGTVVKVVARQKLDDKRDVCFVVMPALKLIKTVWVNVRGDKHATLDRTKFVRP